MTTADLITDIEEVGFECEAGPLTNFQNWFELKEKLLGSWPRPYIDPDGDYYLLSAPPVAIYIEQKASNTFEVVLDVGETENIVVTRKSRADAIEVRDRIIKELT